MFQLYYQIVIPGQSRLKGEWIKLSCVLYGPFLCGCRQTQLFAAGKVNLLTRAQPLAPRETRSLCFRSGQPLQSLFGALKASDITLCARDFKSVLGDEVRIISWVQCVKDVGH